MLQSVTDIAVDVDLSGKVALVTGGGGGIGAGIADVRSRAGAHVVVAERDAPPIRPPRSSTAAPR